LPKIIFFIAIVIKICRRDLPSSAIVLVCRWAFFLKFLILSLLWFTVR
jgi:hypothetical protein